MPTPAPRTRLADASELVPSPQQIKVSRYTLVVSGLFCRLGLLVYLPIGPDRRLRATILLVVVALFPCALASVLVGRLRSVAGVVAVTVLVMIGDILVTIGALFPGSSTDAVGLLTEPIFASGALMLALMFTRRPDRTH
jgi:hypothetical protein